MSLRPRCFLSALANQSRTSSRLPYLTHTLDYAPSTASLHPIHRETFVTGSVKDEWVRVHDAETGEEKEVGKGHHGPVSRSTSSFSMLFRLSLLLQVQVADLPRRLSLSTKNRSTAFPTHPMVKLTLQARKMVLSAFGKLYRRIMVRGLFVPKL